MLSHKLGRIAAHIAVVFALGGVLWGCAEVPEKPILIIEVPVNEGLEINCGTEVMSMERYMQGHGFNSKTGACI